MSPEDQSLYEDHRLLFAGRVAPYKGVPARIRAVRELDDPELTALVSPKAALAYNTKVLELGIGCA
jgi:hypothetical protein